MPLQECPICALLQRWIAIAPAERLQSTEEIGKADPTRTKVGVGMTKNRGLTSGAAEAASLQILTVLVFPQPVKPRPPGDSYPQPLTDSKSSAAALADRCHVAAAVTKARKIARDAASCEKHARDATAPQARSDRQRCLRPLPSRHLRDTTPPAAVRRPRLAPPDDGLSSPPGPAPRPPPALLRREESPPAGTADRSAPGAPTCGLAIVMHVGPANILVERPRAPHVERLHSVADPQHRLAHVVRVLQQELVDVVAERVRWRGLRRRSVPYFSGSTSAGLPGSSTPSHCLIACAISRGRGIHL